MSWAFRCRQFGLQFADAPGLAECPCGKRHRTHEAGVPPAREAGPIHVIGDKLPKHYDWAAGDWIDSRAQRKRIYKQKGLNLTSASEYKQRSAGKVPESLRIRRLVSYPGQTCRKSTAERQKVV